MRYIITNNENTVKVRDLSRYIEVITSLVERSKPLNEFERYFDCLESPLQPLGDNLLSENYEVFEKDSPKYIYYERAITEALLDRKDSSQPIVIAVVGAGRGPLVQASLNASEKSGVVVKVFAVEKNPNPLNTLLDRFFDVSNVSVVGSDMRAWKPSEKVDILVSELLGSFGDNELSPECLDGVEHVLKSDGISIPFEYTAYAAPILSERLYCAVANVCANFKRKALDWFQIPFVVNANNYYMISSPEKCFTFVHPSVGKRATLAFDEKVETNERYAVCNFRPRVPCGSMLNGFIGFFEAKLYKDVTLSTLPSTHTPEMYSWFPYFFPLKHPLVVQQTTQRIEFDLWRRVGDGKVWYEWMAAVVDASQNRVETMIHNPNGCEYRIKL